MRSYWFASITFLAIVISLILPGCDQTPSNHRKIAQAEKAVNQAAECGTSVDASLECYLAREKLNAARDALESRRYVEANRLAEKAAVDVELARAKGASARATKSLDELRRSVKVLQGEINRAKSY